jgi:hypothetical protein
MGHPVSISLRRGNSVADASGCGKPKLIAVFIPIRDAKKCPGIAGAS